jgi:hypothetical protein
MLTRYAPTYAFYAFMQCCGSGSRILIFTRPGSRMLIPDPGSLISDPGSKNSNKFHKIENYFIFEMLKKKNLGQFSKNYRTFYLKIWH